MSDEKLFLEARGVSKNFGSLAANSEVNLQVRAGEIHAVIGENGAGKSTLMKILYGMYSPDEGELYVRGKKVQFESPMDALSLGIGMVHQHFMLVERMTVLENFILGSEPSHFGIIDEKKARESLQSLIDESHTSLNPEDEIRKLTVGQEQRLEILKLLYRKSECLIFDEPTGVLTPQEVDQFLQSLLNLKSKGKTIILITHKLNEVMAVADQITVLRSGKSVASVSAKSTNVKELARLLVGREVRAFDERSNRDLKPAMNVPAVLDLKKISGDQLKNINLQVFPGEILGIAGIEGNGQRELAEAIIGSKKFSGNILFKSRDISNDSIEVRKKEGISFIPEDRHKNGLVLDFSLNENFYLGVRVHLKNSSLIPFSKLKKLVQESLERFQIKAKGPEAKARSLSGGNQQKAIVARELFGDPKLLVAAQPTRGVDIGAIEKIHDELLQRANSGMSILLISSELDELLSLSDRILVLREGEISAEFKDVAKVPAETLRYEIGEAMICKA